MKQLIERNEPAEIGQLKTFVIGITNPSQVACDASVVIVVKDEPSIRVSLELLQTQCESNHAECVVIDASEGRLQQIASDFPWVRWIDYEQPRGRRFTIAHQRNAGVRAARSGRIAFCDAGFEPSPDWLAQILGMLDKYPMACCCGRIDSLDSPPLPTVNNLPEGTDISFSCTANMALSVMLFEAVGGFREEFDHGEDIDFGWRVRDLGYPVLCASTALMRVRWGDSRRQVRRAYLYGRSTPRLLLRNPAHVLEYCRTYTDTVLYPAWLVGLPLAIAIGVLYVWWVPLAWLAGLFIPAIKNRKEQRKFHYLLVKLTRAAGCLLAAPGFLATRAHGVDARIAARMLARQ